MSPQGVRNLFHLLPTRYLMIKPPFFSFTAWLGSRHAVSFALGTGILFLFSNYQKIIHVTDPDNTKQAFAYPFELRVALSHLDSFFFALATIIFIFQSRSRWQKTIFCILETIAIALNLNRPYLGENGLFFLSCYIALFSGLTLFFLGNLAKQHLDQAPCETPRQSSSSPIQTPIVNVFGEPYQTSLITSRKKDKPVGFVVGEKNLSGRKPLSAEVITAIRESLKNGLGVRATARKYGVSEATVSKYKTS